MYSVYPFETLYGSTQAYYFTVVYKENPPEVYKHTCKLIPSDLTSEQKLMHFIHLERICSREISYQVSTLN